MDSSEYLVWFKIVPTPSNHSDSVWGNYVLGNVETAGYSPAKTGQLFWSELAAATPITEEAFKFFKNLATN